ncbi:MAG: hypothetical protein CMP23_07100 [Rickettsiales bacterium]|nr:hypothetical protein [Rickettsiales bacterium]
MERCLVFCGLFTLALVACGDDSTSNVVEATPAPQPEQPLVDPALEPDLVGEADDEAELIIEDSSLPAAPVAAPVRKRTPRKKPVVAAKEPAPPPKGMRRGRLGGGVQEEPAALDSKQIGRIIKKRSPQVRACYERELKKNSALEGKVLVSWTIAADGSARSARAKSNTTGSRTLASCVTQVVSRWRFPQSNSASDIEYPFVFKSSERWR